MEKSPTPIGPFGKRVTWMNPNTEFDEPTVDNQRNDIDRAAELLPVLQELFKSTVISRRNLQYATNVLCQLESLHINRASEAHGELLRLRRIWKKRIDAQNYVDRWLIEHGHPVC